MTWTDYINSVKTVMEANGYKKLPFTYSVVDAPASYSDRAYTVMPFLPFDSDATGKAIIRRKYAHFEIIYKTKDDDEFNKKYDEFLAIIEQLPNGTFIEESPSYEPLDTVDISYSIGKFTLLVTTEVIC